MTGESCFIDIYYALFKYILEIYYS